ncbi:unnamed protein product [Cyclocybe aegerita]|uniref:Rho-GAP domain-containing protein n=1 Tax=Cyclocybe aegerita TaxID=1973307 RepID=A0A8S0VUA2_CYCAE|nr:unnamed protein product [Cyclocybe aegerita]
MANLNRKPTPYHYEQGHPRRRDSLSLSLAPGSREPSPTGHASGVSSTTLGAGHISSAVPVPSSEPTARNPRIHRQSGIPSISRPRGSTIGSSTYGLSSSPSPGSAQLQTPTPLAPISTSKKASYALLSVSPTPAHAHDPAERRAVSTPDPPDRPDFYKNINEYKHTGASSPPLVDFTRFEDTYRPPRERRFEGLLAVSSMRSGFGLSEGLGLGPRERGEMRSVSGGAVLMGNDGQRGGVGRQGLKSALKHPAPREDFSFGTPMQSSGATGAGGPTITVSEPPLPASARKPDPRLVLDTLEELFALHDQTAGEKALGHLDAYELLGAHQLDLMDFEERERIRGARMTGQQTSLARNKRPLAVLGEPIRRASLYASTQMVLAGREHELPILIVHCVEELYRTGIYQPSLFRTLPNRARLLELIGIFDSEVQPPGSIIRSRSKGSRANISMGYSYSGSSDGGGGVPGQMMGFGSATSLHLESTPDVCALLATYLSSLPEPILPASLFEAIWDACAIGEDEEKDGDSERGSDTNTPIGGQSHLPASASMPTSGYAFTSSLYAQAQGHPSAQTFAHPQQHHPRARIFNSSADHAQILAAQLLLHLLPSPHFSLLIYLLAFFSQVVLVRDENGVGIEDVGRMFGARVFGTGGGHARAENTKGKGRSKERGKSREEGRQRGEAMMVWFLHRWGLISETLFEVVEEAKMRRSRVMRRDSLGGYVVRGLSQEQEEESDEEDGEDEGDMGRDEGGQEHGLEDVGVRQPVEGRGRHPPTLPPKDHVSALQQILSTSRSPPRARSPLAKLSEADQESISNLRLLQPPALQKSLSASDSSRYSFHTPLPRIRLQDVDLEELRQSTPRVRGKSRDREGAPGMEEDGFVLSPRVPPSFFISSPDTNTPTSSASARHGDINPVVHSRLLHIRERDRNHAPSTSTPSILHESGPTSARDAPTQDESSATLTLSVPSGGPRPVPRIERAMSHDSASASVYSMPSLSERLMDLSMSTLMDVDTSMPQLSIGDEPEAEQEHKQEKAKARTDNIAPLAVPPKLARRHSSGPTLSRIPASRSLRGADSKEKEKKVENLEKALAAAQAELAEERAKVGRLEARVRELEGNSDVNGHLDEDEGVE